MELTTSQFMMAATAAFLVGFSKTGMPGLGILIVPLMAAAFPAKASVGVLLPILLFGDVFAVARYRRHADWGILLRLLPWVIIGIGLGSVALHYIATGALQLFLGVLVLLLIVLQFAKDRSGPWLEEHLPRKWWFSALMGLLAGFATGVANLAGMVTGVYFISMNLKKHSFMGTAALFYMIVNIVKVPIFIYLGIINKDSFLFDLKVYPAVAFGAVAGYVLFRYIPQKWFNRVILFLAAIAAVKLLMK